jgi:7-cyano-7-deazaguanine synthase
MRVLSSLVRVEAGHYAAERRAYRAIVVERFQDGQGSAVLFSGGLDSAVLLALAAERGPAQPLYVSVGLAWEHDELAATQALLAARPFADTVRPLVPLRFDMTDVYPPDHWAVRGEAPGYDTPDEDVYLEGRNIVLLAKAAVFMARHGLARVMIGPLAGNPFPDASASFFASMSHALATGLAKPLEIEAPLSNMHKADVIRLGVSLGIPLELTLSCMQPVDGLHCGRCSKCRERRNGFGDAGQDDRTRYVCR